MTPLKTYTIYTLNGNSLQHKFLGFVISDHSRMPIIIYTDIFAAMAGQKKRDFSNPDIENIALGLAIRAFRKTSKKSQEQLAVDAGLDRTYISLVERGQRSPTFSTIYSICLGLEITVADLMTTVNSNIIYLSSEKEFQPVLE